MIEHLPECAVAAARPGTFLSCICDALRACEQRSKLIGYALGQADMRRYLLSDDTGSFTYGRRDGLDAAREAVAKAPMGSGAYNTKAADIAAIDALREAKS